MFLNKLIFFRSEYGAFWKCIQAGGIYVFTQLVKMLALATFFPTADNIGEEGFDVFGVCITRFFSLQMLIFYYLFYLLSLFKNKYYIKYYIDK
jgi:hypothetical protein